MELWDCQDCQDCQVDNGYCDGWIARQVCTLKNNIMRIPRIPRERGDSKIYPLYILRSIPVYDLYSVYDDLYCTVSTVLYCIINKLQRG